MKVLGINGSHRYEKTTRKYLDLAMEEIKKEGFETEILELSKLNIEDCNVCEKCREEPCPIQDDMQEVYKKLEESDGIILASPVYFGTVSAKLKRMMDRTLYLRRKNMALSGKVGGAISVGRTRNGGQEFTNMAIYNFMFIHEMIAVSDKSTAHFGGIAHSGVEEDPEGEKTCRNLGRKVAETLKKLSPNS
ncbi:MAG: flavodoxin family protein [Candidatus Hydrothermarchaeota archaeon]